MSNTNANTVFISGLGIKVNENDKIVFLSLIDAMNSEDEYIYNFALPQTILKNLVEGLTLASKELEVEIEVDSVKLEE